MKNTHLSILAVVVLAFFTVSTATVQGEGEDYTYVTNNGTITITGYTGPGGNVTIPDTINGLTVTSVGDGAFDRCATVTSVTIPNRVSTIGEDAFWGCGSLTNVIIGNGVTSIGDRAFIDCGNLTRLTIPDSVTAIGRAAFGWCTGLANLIIGNSVTSIGYGAFGYCSGLCNVTIPENVANIEETAFGPCTSLKAITVDPANRVYSSLDGVLFNKNRTVLIQFPGGKCSGYRMPDSVISIGSSAFLGCTCLTNVLIGHSVTSIEPQAFVECTSLTSLTTPGSVATIGYEAFQNCSSLTASYFEGNAPSIDFNAFAGATNTTIYYLPGTIGWTNTYADRPTAPWVLPNPVALTTAPAFGIQTNAFGFRVSWATNASVVVDASKALANPVWSPVSTNTLINGWSYFSDAEWKNYPARFYRIRSL